MGKIRAFFALNMSERAQGEIFKIQKELSEIKSDIKWEPKEKFHITLKFLGDVDEQILKNLTDELKYELKDFGKFDLLYKGLGCFPNMRLPRVIWIGAEDNEKKLFALNKSIEEKAKSYNFERESNKFHPHITLGRVKGSKGVNDVIKILKELNHEAINDTASEVYVMKSILQKTGSVYEIIDRIII